MYGTHRICLGVGPGVCRGGRRDRPRGVAAVRIRYDERWVVGWSLCKVDLPWFAGVPRA
jgi:hypothetical protein